MNILGFKIKFERPDKARRILKTTEAAKNLLQSNPEIDQRFLNEMLSKISNYELHVLNFYEKRN